MADTPLFDTILLIDDEADFRNVIAWKLERGGQYKVMKATDGASGVALAKQHHPDVILTDFTMPQMNGHDVLRHIRADPGTKDIPVIVLTSLGAEQKMADSMNLGATCHVEKWADSKILLEEIKTAIAKHRAAHKK